jgi:3-dehydroquinate dehydratase/shikimate dehydrogenase
VDAAQLPEGPRLYTLRGVSEDRRARLARAAATFELVDLEPRDLDDRRLLRELPPERRVITWRGRAESPDELSAILQALSRTPARLYRLELDSPRGGEALFPLQMLRASGRDDVTAYALGACGFWTRIMAPHLGARFAFGIAGSAELDGLPTVAQWIEDYGFPQLGAPEQIFGIVGCPVLRSLSPRLHNAGFRALGRRALYLPFHVSDFGDFWTTLIENGGLEGLGFTVAALTVVSPHKEVAMAAAGAKTAMVARAGSTNFFVNAGGLWTAGTTDPEGVLLTLRERGIEPRDRRVAVVGCGGSGRAIAAALQQAGAEVTLVNRGFDRASLAVRLLRLPFRPLASFSARGFSIVVNATPVGLELDELPFDMAELAEDAVIVDLVYGLEPTALVARTRARGQVTIDGHDVLRTQAMSQFHLMTGEPMPAEALRSIGSHS